MDINDKEIRKQMKEWANSQESALFCGRIVELIEDARNNASKPYERKVPVEFTNVQRADAVSRGWAFDDVLEVIEELKK